MKYLFSPKKNRSLTYLFFFISAFSILTLSSCLKDNDNHGRDTITAALTVIDGAVNAPTVNFVLDGNPFTDAYGQIVDFSFGIRFPYVLAYSGNRSAAFYEKGTRVDPLYRSTIKLLPSKYYSLFLAGVIGTAEADTLSTLLLEDDLTKPTGDNAKVRFINLSPDAGALDLIIETGKVFASNKEFKDYTTFQDIPAGTYTAQFKSTTGTVVDYDFELKLEKGQIYTVWARGLVTVLPDSHEFENGLIIHNK